MAIKVLFRRQQDSGVVVMTVKIKSTLGTGELQGSMVEEGMNSVLGRLVFSEKGTCEWGLDVRVGVSWGRVSSEERDMAR